MQRGIGFLKEHVFAILFCFVCLVLSFTIEGMHGEFEKAVLNAEDRIGELERKIVEAQRAIWTIE